MFVVFKQGERGFLVVNAVSENIVTISIVLDRSCFFVEGHMQNHNIELQMFLSRVVIHGV